MVHDDNPDCPYKDPYIRRIKVAFAAIRRRLCLATRDVKVSCDAPAS